MLSYFIEFNNLLLNSPTNKLYKFELFYIV